MECYNYLEPLYNDYRKLKRKNRNGGMFLDTLPRFENHVELIFDEFYPLLLMLCKYVYTKNMHSKNAIAQCMCNINTT